MDPTAIQEIDTDFYIKESRDMVTIIQTLLKEGKQQLILIHTLDIYIIIANNDNNLTAVLNIPVLMTPMLKLNSLQSQNNMQNIQNTYSK